MDNQLYVVDDNGSIWRSGFENNYIEKNHCFSKIDIPDNILVNKVVKNDLGTLIILDDEGYLWVNGYDTYEEEYFSEFSKIKSPKLKDKMKWYQTIVSVPFMYNDVEFIDVDINNEFIFAISSDGDLWGFQIQKVAKNLEYTAEHKFSPLQYTLIKSFPKGIRLNKIYVEKKFDEIVYIATDENGNGYIQFKAPKMFYIMDADAKKGKIIKAQAFTRYEKFLSTIDKYENKMMLVPYIAFLTNKGYLTIATLESDGDFPSYYPIEKDIKISKGFEYLNNKTEEFVMKTVVIYDNITDFSSGYNYIAMINFDKIKIYGFNFPNYNKIFNNKSQYLVYNNYIRHNIPGSYNITQIFCLDQSIFFIDSNKKLWGYGDNSNGQLGLSTKSKYIKQFIDLGLIDSHFNDIASWFMSENILDLDNFYELTDI